MRIVLSLFLLVALNGPTYAQRVEKRNLKATSLTLRMPDREEMAGTRGIAVVWNPILKRYYAAFAGNVGFPLSIFDAKGKRLSSNDLNTNADLRGLWFNAKLKTLQGNCYSDGGWVQYTMSRSGEPTDPVQLFEGKNQPDDQSIGTFNPLTQKVLFLDGRILRSYDLKTSIEDETNITLAYLDDIEAEMDPEEVGMTTFVAYTGIKGKELAAIYTNERKIVLFNIVTGKISAEYKLPDDSVEPSTMFNFSYANGMFWLFDMDARTWMSYK